MIWNRLGITREVILTRNYAVKLPKLTYGWRKFLQGLLANMQEMEFAKADWPELCPIVWAIPGGWCVVMKRAAEMSREDWGAFLRAEFNIPADSDFWKGARQSLPPWITHSPDYVVPAELKRDSFGRLNGRIVAVDYGN